jgi:hypothetical protein
MTVINAADFLFSFLRNSGRPTSSPILLGDKKPVNRPDRTDFKAVLIEIFSKEEHKKRHFIDSNSQLRGNKNMTRHKKIHLKKPIVEKAD